MEKKKVPEIRLEGFEGEWESCELKEIATFSKGTGYSKSDLVSAGNPIILYGRMYTNHETIISNVDTFAVPKKNSVYSRGGEVIVPASGESAEDISVASVVKNPDILLGGDLNIITPNKNIDPAFLALVISYGKAHDDMAKMAHGKTVVHLHNDDLEQVQFIHPQYDEQRAITNYIGLIDTTIKCQQERHTKLLVLKKSLLQKMFPQEGESVPQIRFEGFEGEWDKKKLGTIAKEIVRKDANSHAPVMMISAASGFIYQSDRYSTNNAGQSLPNYTVLRKNELAYNHGFSNLRPFGSCFNLKIEEARVPFVYHCFSVSDNNSAFISMELNSYFVEQQLHKLVSSTARMDGLLNISFEDYATVEIFIPHIDEQQKIADYFDNLDTLIESQEQKITKLQQMKSALLQKMFV